MRIRKLRSTSLGLSGTVANAQHHAKKLLPLIDALSRQAEGWIFEEWAQGNNVHVFTALDGRKFVLRPMRDGEYAGIRVYARVSRTTEIPLITVYADTRNGVTVYDVSRMMNIMALPIIPDLDGKIESDPAAEI